MMKRIAVLALGALGLLAAVVGYNLVVHGGALVEVQRHAPGACRVIGEAPGPEDMALDRERGVLYVSSHDRRHPKTLGAIYAADLRRPFGELSLGRLGGAYPERFYPHGVSLYAPPGAAPRLYAISHAGVATATSPLDFGADHRIEVLALEPGGVRSIQTLRGEGLRSPNDLHVRAPDDIYISQDHGASSRPGKLVEEFLRLPRSALLRFDGAAFRPVIEGLRYANGVTGAGDRLYVAEILARQVREYAVEGPGRLRQLRILPLPSAPDNLELGEDGALWIGAHAALFQFLRHAIDPARPSPSQALRLPLGSGPAGAADAAQPAQPAQIIYADPGAEISGSSVAVHAGHLLLLGGVFDPRVIACQLP